MRCGGGRIVNIGAGAAVAKSGAGMGAYTASKSGVLKLTEALAEELKDHGITVNAILPSTIDTPANRADMPNADFTRWVAPRDIANVIVFLLTDQARAVTGALIPVSGESSSAVSLQFRVSSFRSLDASCRNTVVSASHPKHYCEERRQYNQDKRVVEHGAAEVTRSAPS